MQKMIFITFIFKIGEQIFVKVFLRFILEIMQGEVICIKEADFLLRRITADSSVRIADTKKTINIEVT